jgi:hypothetical protein
MIWGKNAVSSKSGIAGTFNHFVAIQGKIFVSQMRVNIHIKSHEK